ncbi:GNAT family N-acetyltransferase [Saccharospirillum mangrovi]|uniref:GNAT family N-acetyltransferase n=1 Tax=Saccharospirillum mangrovi TaxID=2161747 RepID=UPI000D39CED3|nr:GNAT family N-acetyltransferase [Saccharospirillum mangrovi]
MSLVARALTPSDQSALVDFLMHYRDTSLFLLSNLERSGVVAGDEPYQGHYWGAFDGDTLVGALAHYWQGIVMPAAPQGLDLLAPLLAEQADRPIQGFIGVRDQVDWLSDFFQVTRWRIDAPEPLYTLELNQLRWPDVLQHGDLVVRHATAADEDQLVEWRIHYVGEAMSEPDNAETRRRARTLMQQEINDGDLFVLCDEDELLAMSAFNAVAAQTVQIGGVYTPPSQRSKGYGRAVVAGSLALARSQGMTRSVLFTGHDNHAAQRAYESLGYQRIGEFGMKFLDEPLLAERA